jgi:hypothetical protein
MSTPDEFRRIIDQIEKYRLKEELANTKSIAKKSTPKGKQTKPKGLSVKIPKSTDKSNTKTPPKPKEKIVDQPAPVKKSCKSVRNMIKSFLLEGRMDKTSFADFIKVRSQKVLISGRVDVTGRVHVLQWE